MSKQQQDAPPGPEKTVTVLNIDPFLRTIDLGKDDDGVSRRVTIPPAKVDGFHRTDPGRTTMKLSEWEGIKVHPSAKFLVMKGNLSLLLA